MLIERTGHVLDPEEIERPSFINVILETVSHEEDSHAKKKKKIGIVPSFGIQLKTGRVGV